MPLRIWLRLAEILAPVLIVITIVIAWEAGRRDRAQLAAQLASAQQTIAQAAANQKDRDTALTQTLAQIAAQKQSTLSTDQLLKLLPQALSLPAPITLQAGNSANANVGASPDAAHSSATSHDTTPLAPPPNLPANPTPKTGQTNTAPGAILPSTDLKPLYDFALDCQACQAKLSAAQADLADEKTKSASLTRERDAAIRSAKGGSALRRIARAAKWFLIGAAAGAVAAKAVR